MTYYEVVSLLDNMITSQINDSDIERITNADISLNGMRYDRFIVQMNYFLTERLGYVLDNTISKIKSATFGASELALEMSLIKNEVSLLEKLINIKQIKEENKVAFKKSLKENVNKMLSNLKEFFIDEEKIRIIDECMMMEDGNNEL